ncbi:MAG: hypothetical protein EBT13_18265, partial [Rhodobacteraceae bacterium]|nr:hypothetical protein [Paracoccaceae bacterium]
MSDLSTLRIGVDSRDVRTATNDLNALGRAADGAENATDGVGGAARRTSAALSEMQRFAAQANATMAATRQA